MCILDIGTLNVSLLLVYEICRSVVYNIENKRVCGTRRDFLTHTEKVSTRFLFIRKVRDIYYGSFVVEI